VVEQLHGSRTSISANTRCTQPMTAATAAAAAASATRTRSRSSNAMTAILCSTAVTVALTIYSVDRQDHFAVSYARDSPAAATLRRCFVKWCEFVQKSALKPCARPAHCVLLVCAVAGAKVTAAVTYQHQRIARLSHMRSQRVSSNSLSSSTSSCNSKAILSRNQLDTFYAKRYCY
jgi:hypothetical protein